MAKLFCVLNNKNSGIQEGIIRSLDYNPGWQKKTFRDRDIFLGCVELPFKSGQDYWKETADFVVVIDGEILSWDHAVPGESTTEKILNIFKERGETLVQHVNGHFSIVIWDKKKRTLHIMNDRLGLRPLYYAQYREKTFFASEIKAILADQDFNKKCNIDAVIDFFSYEYVLNDQTLLEGIKVFPYASTVKLDSVNGPLNFNRYWDLQFNQEFPKERTITQYAWKFNAVTRRAVERAMQGPHKIGLPLTGGLDSRVIAALIDRKYYPLDTYTFGMKGSIDVAIARKISRMIGAKHHITEIKYNTIADLMIKGVFMTDGMQGCNSYHILNIMDEMGAAHFVALTGFIGGMLPRRMYGGYVGKGKEDVYSAFDTGTLKFREKVFNGEFQKAVGSGKERFFDLWDEISQKNKADPLDYLNLTQRQRRYINYGTVLMRNYLEVRTPFADYEYVDFCLKMPHIFKEDAFIYKEMLNICHAPFARVKQEATGMSLRPGRLERKFAKTMDKLLGKPIAYRRPAYDYNRFYRIALKDFTHRILFSQKFKNRQIFNQEIVEHMVNDHMTGKGNYAPQLGVLITFELWNRLFMDGDKELLEGLVNV